MNINKIFSLLLVTLILGTRVGFALNIHYCENTIAEISIAYNPQNCGMENEDESQTEHKTSFSKKSCCEDEVFLFQNQEPQKHQTEFLSQEILFTKNALISIETLQRLDITEVEKISIWCPTPESKKLFLINQSLVFYD
jgi:hypothetical protein